MKPKNRLTREEHELWGRELRDMQRRLKDLRALLYERYPMAQRTGAARAMETLEMAGHYLTHARDALSTQAELDLPDLDANVARRLYLPADAEPDDGSRTRQA
jgi:hypothetical protein